MSKISELEDGGSIQASDYLIVVRSGGNLKVRMNQITVDQVNLGDNEFIRLGNSQDLTLVHDASNSIINQAGIGDLLIQKAGSTKLTVNSSGIDVTGTVTASGAATFSGNITVNGGNAVIGTGGGGNGLGALISKGAVANFYEAYDGTKTMIAGTDAGNDYVKIGSLSAHPVGFVVGNGEKVRIDASGNVGIGATTALTGTYLSKAFVQTAGGANFAIGGSSNTNNAVLSRFTSYNTANSNSGNESSGNFYGVTSIESIVVTTDSNAGDDSGGSILFKTKPEAGALQEVMRIRSDGVVGIGNGGLALIRLAVTNSVVGANIETTSATAGHEALIVNRQNSDGIAIAINKAGTTVGSIGIESSGFYIDGEASHSGLSFGGNSVVARDNGTRVDDTVDLGSDVYRFKDLFLSGAVIIDVDGATNNAWAHFKNDDRTWLAGCRGSDGDSFTIYDLTADEPRVKVDASGNLLVGTTTVPSQTTGVSTGVYFVVKGDIIPSVDAGFTGHSDLGDASTRYEDAYVRDGVTIGSDGNDKQDIEALSDAEQRVAVACKGLLRKWRWKDAVEEKGGEARIHFGIIAQDLQAAFEAEGLDAGRYAMFMSNTWTDEETGEERTRLGVRYHELLAFIIAAI